MRKDLDKMTPEELLRERRYQEDNFRYLVSDMIYPDALPKTRWREAITTMAEIIFWTIILASVVVGVIYLLIACLA